MKVVSAKQWLASPFHDLHIKHSCQKFRFWLILSKKKNSLKSNLLLDWIYLKRKTPLIIIPFFSPLIAFSDVFNHMDLCVHYIFQSILVFNCSLIDHTHIALAHFWKKKHCLQYLLSYHKHISDRILSACLLNIFSNHTYFTELMHSFLWIFFTHYFLSHSEHISKRVSSSCLSVGLLWDISCHFTPQYPLVPPPWLIFSTNVRFNGPRYFYFPLVKLAIWLKASTNIFSLYFYTFLKYTWRLSFRRQVQNCWLLRKTSFLLRSDNFCNVTNRKREWETHIYVYGVALVSSKNIYLSMQIRILKILKIL